MDVKMPHMDGIKATKEIRRLWPQGPKIIAIIAYAMESDRERCLQAGMDGYIAKPVQQRCSGDVRWRLSRSPTKDSYSLSAHPG